jgi:hypothetical protein
MEQMEKSRGNRGPMATSGATSQIDVDELFTVIETARQMGIIGDPV